MEKTLRYIWPWMFWYEKDGKMRDIICDVCDETLPQDFCSKPACPFARTVTVNSDVPQTTNMITSVISDHSPTETHYEFKMEFESSNDEFWEDNPSVSQVVSTIEDILQQAGFNVRVKPIKVETCYD